MSVKSYTEVRQRFSKLIGSLISFAQSSYTAATNKGPRSNFAADKNGWTGDSFDLDGISKAFSRAEHVTDVQQAISSVDNAGTVGDLVSSVRQGDYLAVHERAFRSMNLGRVRASIHAGARFYGHQHAAGLFAKGVNGEVADIVRRAKDFASS